MVESWELCDIKWVCVRNR